jgi:hypothetical protein
MDIQVDFFRWQVPNLKEYLQHWGITCHLYRKHELVKLYEFAQELDLEKITSTTDYELSQVNRRTITENGVTQVVCEIGQVPIWSSDLKLLPNIEQCDILFIKKVWLEGWYDLLKLYKKERKCFIYFPRFLPSDLHWGTQHQSLESLMGLSIFTVNDVVFTFTSGVATQTGSNDACSLRQITWSINEKTGLSAGMEMTRKYRITALHFVQYDVLWSTEKQYWPRPSALVNITFQCSITHHIALKWSAIIVYYSPMSWWPMNNCLYKNTCSDILWKVWYSSL